MEPRCDLVGVEKKPRPSEGRAEPYLSYSGLLAAFRTENNSGRGAWFLKKGPAEAGPSTRVISLRKEGYLGLPQLDNSAIRRAGIRSSSSERLMPECCRGATDIRSQIGEHFKAVYYWEGYVTAWHVSRAEEALARDASASSRIGGVYLFGLRKRSR